MVNTPTTTIFHGDLLKGKVALITGGGSGIGLGLATAFARHGATVIIIGRNKERLEKAAKSIYDVNGGKCITASADVRDATALRTAIHDAVNSLNGKLDILVNCAAGNFLAPLANLSTNAFKTVVDIDLLGTFNATKACQEFLFASKGCILNISATLSYRGNPLQGHPAAAKAGVDSLTRTLATEWGPKGVRTNGIAPGPIDDTEGLKRLMPKGARDQLINGLPLQRAGTINDIEHAALFLVSPSASYINGHTLVVDGGDWLTASFYQYPQVLENFQSSKL
ncbi:peroxisomal 2,4-dienoyl-CoA reductase [Syncephalis plumigaleata]|nr:peroxisomal 2,4-dienoyl-CoA reductase [Syncephalis plumigaleata]